MAMKYVSKEFIRISHQTFPMKYKHHLVSFICIALIHYKRFGRNRNKCYEPLNMLSHLPLRTFFSVSIQEALLCLIYISCVSKLPSVFLNAFQQALKPFTVRWYSFSGECITVSHTLSFLFYA